MPLRRVMACETSCGVKNEPPGNLNKVGIEANSKSDSAVFKILRLLEFAEAI